MLKNLFSGRRLRAGVALAVSIGLVVPSFPIYAGPMAINSQVVVSESGSATYSIPLQIPPGTGGMDPKLTLAYNSQTGNGLLGVGWSLSGLSAITRCPRTIAQDGVKAGIHLDASDRYCLDGQRLIVVSGTYGAANSEYRTERDVFSKVIGYGGVTGDNAYFKVWTKSGQIIEYGNTADSRIEAQGKSQARVWAANKVSDTNGNYLSFTYTEDSTNGDYYPQRIDYTGNASAGLSPNNSVQFVYETRPDVTAAYSLGSLIKATQRLTKIQTYVGANQVKEIRFTYGISTSTGRSRITGISECALPDNLCKPTVSPTWTEYGSNTINAGSKWTSLVASYLADVNGDGKADFVAQQSDGLYVALSTGSSATSSSKWIGSFGSTQGYSDQTITPIFLADVNADGLADVVGIASDGVYVALSNGFGFNAPVKWTTEFTTTNGWANMDVAPRNLIDVNGDGRPDLIGFKSDGIYVALNTGSSFSAAAKWTTEFGSASTVPYPTNSANPRMVADVNGDGLPDIVGFANGGVYVALNTGTGFAASTLMLSDFGVNAGYTTMDTYPRTLADVNGDGLPDIVGFKADGAYVSINTGNSFQAATKWLSDFGTSAGYSTQKGFPRFVADVNGDGKADIVGFASSGVYVALSTGTAFSTGTQWVTGFGSSAGYTTGTPRQLADIDGDGFPDVVGTLSSGTTVGATGRSVVSDLITGFPNGMGATATVTYAPLTSSSIYTRGTEATYPQMDITIPFYVAATVKNPNGLGSGFITNSYQYGGLRVDLSGRGLVGFSVMKAKQVDSGITTENYYRQDWPYSGLPSDVVKTLPGYGNNGVLNAIVNTYSCINPANGAACAITAGNRYFPYASQSRESTWDSNGVAFPNSRTTNTFDSNGNATAVVVETSDGYSKTTTNTYAANTASWLLGRLTKSVVSSTTGVASPTAPSAVFNFNATITANTTNYNVRSAAVTAGWDQSAVLFANITINSGVTVSSSSTAVAAFSTGTSLPGGSRITLINNGSIIGKGGAGANGANVTTTSFITGAPGNGGPGISATIPISITNNGTIAGGGGGGGAGGGYKINVTTPAIGTAYAGSSGGGGGAGGGAGGSLGNASGGAYVVAGANGVAGTMTAGGAGGGNVTCWNNSGVIANSGGAGGGLGQPGASGSATYGTAGIDANHTFGAQVNPGGPAGFSVVGNISVTWLTVGTRLGPTQ